MLYVELCSLCGLVVRGWLQTGATTSSCLSVTDVQRVLGESIDKRDMVIPTSSLCSMLYNIYTVMLCSNYIYIYNDVILT